MNIINSRFFRFLLSALLLSMFCACGGGGGAEPATATLPTVNPPPPPTMALEDAATDHAFMSDHFSGSQVCSPCHNGLQDASGDDVSIVSDWQPTMMAGSSRDPVWRAKVASEIKRNPGLREEIESTCGRCHVPMAHVEAVFATADPILMGDGFLHPDNPLFDAAAEGVSCTLCHQIADTADLGTDTGFSGNFEIPYSFGTDRLAFGQYDNPVTGPMVNQVAYTPRMSPHISDSEVCATCHNLATPVVDAQGAPTNQTFPEQMVYTEWESSDFAMTQSCQDCHMRRAAGNVRISTRPMGGGLSPRTEFARHAIVGGNTYMLDILGRNAVDLNISATGFNELVDETRVLLGGAVNLDLEDISRTGDDLNFTVRLSNQSGHKFPTSYPSRRAWLHVLVTDSQGAMIFESGSIDASGRIAGLASDMDPATFEPHYQAITSGDQVQSYEAIMEDIGGNLTHTLLEAARYRKDNRLLPAGMNKNTVPDSIRPRGDAFTDPDFADGGDLVHYQVAGLVPDVYKIEVRLNYQVLAYSFIQDLLVDNDNARVALFEELNNNARIRFETTTSVTDSINF